MQKYCDFIVLNKRFNKNDSLDKNIPDRKG